MQKQADCPVSESVQLSSSTFKHLISMGEAGLSGSSCHRCGKWLGAQGQKQASLQ